MFLRAFLRLHWVFGLSPSQLFLIWFLWNIFVLFCFVFNNSQIFMYSFIKSLRWQIRLWRPVEAVGNPRVSTYTCFQRREITLGTGRAFSWIHFSFLKPFASPLPTLTGPFWDTIVLWFFLMKQSLKTQPWPYLLSEGGKGRNSRQKAIYVLDWKPEPSFWNKAWQYPFRAHFINWVPFICCQSYLHGFEMFR